MTMSTISFQDPITTIVTPPTVKRRGRIQRPFYSTADKSTDKQPLEATTETHRRGRNRVKDGHRNRSSIHLSVPPIQDRDSSLYSQPALPLPYYDWSKSCSDLTTRNQFPQSASTASRNTRFGSHTNLDQSILGSPYTYTHTTTVIDINNNNNNIQWCHSTLDLSSITDDCHFKLDNQYNLEHEHKTPTQGRHEFTRCPFPESTPRSYDYNRFTSALNTPDPSDKKTKWSTRIGQLGIAKKLRINKKVSYCLIILL